MDGRILTLAVHSVGGFLQWVEDLGLWMAYQRCNSSNGWSNLPARYFVRVRIVPVTGRFGTLISLPTGGFFQWMGDFGLCGACRQCRCDVVAGRGEMGGRSSHRRVNVRDMPTFTKEEIVHLGDLARIALTDEEITRLQGDLNVIAESINKVQEVASDDVPPTANPVPLEAYLRPDVAETPLTQEEALAGGPKTEAGMFVAPRILGSEE